MGTSQFGERTEAFKEALVAQKVKKWLKNASEGETLPMDDEDVKATFKEARKLLHRSLQGYSATQGNDEEKGFKDWMDSLKAFKDTFRAMRLGELIEEQEQATAILKESEDQLKEIIETGKTTNCETAKALFENLAEVRTDEVTSPDKRPYQTIDLAPVNQ